MGLLGRLVRWLVAPLPDAGSSAPDEAIDVAGDASPSDEPVVMPIEDSLDLHYYAPRDVSSVVDEYLRAARDLGHAEVRVIHGRGKGVQRARVQALLARHPAVLRYRSDGLGSTVATLRPRDPARAAPGPRVGGARPPRTPS